MNTELLSVVDENDLVIDTQARHIIHASGLRHRAVHILVFNQQGELFLQKRSMKKDLNKGLWDTSAAGHVDKGEEYTVSAIRETKEELGINIASTLQLLFKLSPTVQLGMEFIQVYQCVHNEPFTLNTDEIDEGDWFSVDDISFRVKNNDPTLTETFKTIWQRYILHAVMK
ncbi:MAG: NUDIX domain-containing protein [Methylococcales bacterium]|nr:NUDIX domain-containing protein [Methylococcales bacterium]